MTAEDGLSVIVVEAVVIVTSVEVTRTSTLSSLALFSRLSFL